MKHIGFDDSVVMAEFLKIASDTGLIKKAEQPAAHRTGVRALITRLSKETGPASVVAKALMGELINWEKVTDPMQLVSMKRRLLSRYTGPLEQKLLNEYILDPAAQGTPAAAQPGAQPAAQNQENLIDLETLYRSIKNSGLRTRLQKDLAGTYKMSPTKLKEYIRLIGFAEVPEELQKILGKFGYTQGNQDMSKHADGKLYDISGETGEQLIDSAHPGGGTRTELSSKTDENLVETIVEQQQRDLEVARSVPKGTYAMLVRLHNKLSKMGYGKRLSSLKYNILRIATEKELVAGILISLADKLDRSGYEKSANRVDQIFKNARPPLYGPTPRLPQSSRAPASSSGDQLLDELAGNLANSINQLPPGSAEEAKQELQQMSNYIKSLKGKGYDQNKITTQLMPMLQQQMNNYSPETRAVLAPLFQDIGGLGGHRTPGGPQSMPQPAPEAGVGAKVQKKQKGVRELFTDYWFARAWGKAFNKILIKVDPKSKVTDIHRMSVVTGDPVARKAKQVSGAFRKSMIRAVKYWKSAGRWKGLEKYLREQFKDELAEVYGSGTLTEDQAIFKMVRSVLARISSEGGGNAAQEPQMQNFVEQAVRAGTRWNDLTNEKGYKQTLSIVLNKVREKGYIR